MQEKNGIMERSAHTKIPLTITWAVPLTNLGGFQFPMGMCLQAEKSSNPI